MTTWVYKRTNQQVWTVGFYDPNGGWQPESDHTSPGAAAERVHYLNGGDSLGKVVRTDLSGKKGVGGLTDEQ